ncbi:MAG: hypothetical protein QOK24_1655, partial [Verrucomicrobiota bacterium]
AIIAERQMKALAKLAEGIFGIELKR